MAWEMIPDRRIPRPARPTIELPMARAIRQWNEAEQQLLAELSQSEWYGESSYGTVLVHVTAQGLGLVLIDTDRDGVYDIQAAGAPGGNLVAADTHRTGGPSIGGAGSGDHFATSVREALRDRHLTLVEADELAAQALTAAGRPLPSSDRSSR